MSLTFIDWFSGIGGFRRGMELAGHKCVGFCEFDKYAVMSYTSMHLITEERGRRIDGIFYRTGNRRSEMTRCKDCEHTKSYRSLHGGVRLTFMCGHPNQIYIIDYFRQHKIKKMPAFLCYGYGKEPTIKTSPAWCPLKWQRLLHGKEKSDGKSN